MPAPAPATAKTAPVAAAPAPVAAGEDSPPFEEQGLDWESTQSWGTIGTGEVDPEADDGTRVRMSLPTIEGAGVDPADVRRRLRANVTQIEACYVKLRSSDDANWSLKVTFTLEPSGRPSNLGLNMDDAKIAGCILPLFKSVAFPKPATRVRVTVPLMFTPK